MITRLPTPGGDDGNWGTILNDFLSQMHTADGSLKAGSVTKAQLASTVQASLDAADAAIPASEKGASGGVASLSGTTLTPTQIPATVVTKSTSSADAGKAIDAYSGEPFVVASGGARQLAYAENRFNETVTPSNTVYQPASLKCWVTIREGFERIRISAELPRVYVSVDGNLSIHLARDSGVAVGSSVEAMLANKERTIFISRDLDLPAGDYSFYLYLQPPTGGFIGIGTLQPQSVRIEELF